MSGAHGDGDGSVSMLIGAYSGAAGGPGLYELHLDGASWRAEPVAGTQNHSWLLDLGDGRMLATVEERDAGVALLAHSVAGWEVAPLDVQVSHACHLARARDAVLVAGYTSGVLDVIDLRAMQPAASLPLPAPRASPHPRQQSPHPHFSAAWEGSWWTSDLGADVIHEVSLHREGGAALTGEIIRLPACSGPRHFVVDEHGLWCVGELDSALHRVRPGARVADARAPRTTRSAADNTPSHVEVIRPGVALVGNRGAGTLGVLDLGGDRAELVAEIALSGPAPRHFRVSGSTVAVADSAAGHVELLRLDASWSVSERVVVPVPGAAFVGSHGLPA